MSDEGNLLRAILNANIVSLQNEAGELLIESVAENNQAGRAAEDKASTALVFIHALDVLEQVGKSDEGLFTLSAEVVE